MADDMKPKHDKLRTVLSGYCREAFERGQSVKIGYQVGITLDNYLEMIPYPKTLPEKMDKVLDYIAFKSDENSNGVKLHNAQERSIAYAGSSTEFDFIKNQLKEMNWIELQEQLYRLTYQGWQHVMENSKTKKNTKQVFVATWFDDSIDQVYVQIKRAIEDCGYTPLWMKTEVHNEKIDDKIIAEIRKSKFMVCDFTGNRPNVYYEAGFAYGLNIPVIRMCKNEEIDKLAFDTRQYNHIAWNNEEDIYQKLKDRIEATII